MKKVIAGVALILIMLVVVMLNFAPDTLSLLMIGLMGLICAVGYIAGMLPLGQYITGFQHAHFNIERVLAVQTSSVWISVQQVDSFFRQKTLDALFGEYVNKVNIQSKEGRIVSDIEEIINEEALALRSWQGVVAQIPGTLTALGLLGTFIGLITGIGTIGYSSVDAALSSIEILLSGIRTAFYTSIVGVVFSIAFNLIYRILWNAMVRELGIFLEDFHLHILPSVEEQERSLAYQYQQQVLERLDRLPKDRGFSMSVFGAQNADPASEQRIMPEIRSGLKNGEFVFFIQPRCDLNNKKIIGGEALARWNHGEMGLVSPAVFLPVVERNGFIVQIDRFIWEEVCKTVRRWVDSGIRPVPISVNISKTDILTMDVPAFFQEMSRKYRIPPRYLEMEISQNAYLQSEAATREVEAQLRQCGYRVTVDGFNGDFVSMNILNSTDSDALRLDLRYMNKSEDEAQSIAAVFEQAKNLQCTVVAQGVENAEQFAILRRCGCEEGQGYYLHKPLPVQDFEALMGNR